MAITLSQGQCRYALCCFEFTLMLSRFYLNFIFSRIVIIRGFDLTFFLILLEWLLHGEIATSI